MTEIENDFTYTIVNVQVWSTLSESDIDTVQYLEVIA